MSRFNDSTSDQVGEYYQAQSWRREGVKEERERIVKLLVEADTTHLNAEGLKGWYFALGLIEGETDE
jgi:hypothetical protein